MKRLEENPTFVNVCMNHPVLFKLWTEFRTSDPFIAGMANPHIEADRERELLIRMVIELSKGKQ